MTVVMETNRMMITIATKLYQQLSSRVPIRLIRFWDDSAKYKNAQILPFALQRCRHKVYEWLLRRIWLCPVRRSFIQNIAKQKPCHISWCR